MRITCATCPVNLPVVETAGYSPSTRLLRAYRQLILSLVCRVTFALLVVGFTGRSRAIDRLPESYDPDVQNLSKAEIFVFGEVGMSPRKTLGEESFAAIVQRKEAIRLMLAAFQEGSPAARCYALVAIRELSEPYFRACLTAFRKNPPKTIRQASGCIISDVKTEAVLQAIETGAYAEWFRHYEERG